MMTILVVEGVEEKLLFTKVVITGKNKGKHYNAYGNCVTVQIQSLLYSVTLLLHNGLLFTIFLCCVQCERPHLFSLLMMSVQF